MEGLWGDLLAAVVGAAITIGVAAWITVAAQRRSLRNELTLRMGRAAYGDYNRAQAYARWARFERVAPRRRREARIALEGAHAEARIEHDAILKAIDLYFGARSEPSVKWHNVIDRLTAHHMLAADAPANWRDATLPKITGERHSGLDLVKLMSLDGLVAGLPHDINAAMHAVRRARWRGRRA